MFFPDLIQKSLHLSQGWQHFAIKFFQILVQGSAADLELDVGGGLLALKLKSAELLF